MERVIANAKPQKTLEGVGERRFPSKMEMYDVFIEGAKWQQERSEQEIKYLKRNE